MGPVGALVFPWLLMKMFFLAWSPAGPGCPVVTLKGRLLPPLLPETSSAGSPAALNLAMSDFTSAFPACKPGNKNHR